MVSQRLIATGVGKILGEAVLTPIIGNGTLFSGAVKLLSGGIARKGLGDSALGKGFVDGMMIDGIEDIIRAIRTGQFILPGGQGISGQATQRAVL